ncbi:uncharacterized protein LOC114586899 [Podarcis muralis]
MATRETFVFVFFMLISPFYPISGNSVRYQKIKDYLVYLCQLYEKILTLWLSTKARVKQMDKFTSESMKAQETQPDIIIIQKESVEAPFGSYTPQAVQESNEVVSKILSDLQPSKPVLWKQLMWQGEIGDRGLSFYLSSDLTSIVA